METEVFAMLCVVESVEVDTVCCATWTTGSDTGSDPDDM